MDKNQPVQIVGAGFSGLSAAYFLQKAGFKIEIFEKSDRAGGLIRSTNTPHGLAESAANAFLNSALLESVAQDIGVEMLRTLPSSKARYLYRDGKAARWPLRFLETIRLLPALFRFLFFKRSLFPKPEQSVATWADVNLGPAARQQLLAPALQGIYAGDVKRLSANLILGHLFKKNGQSKPSFRGSTSPKNGMGEFIEKMMAHLKAHGAVFHFGQEYSLTEGATVILCCPPPAAAQIVQNISPQLSDWLKKIELLPVISVTCFFPESAKLIHGFGCLFPRNEGIRSLGVLSSSEIFAGRGPHTETWILGGAEDPTILQLSDTDLLQIISKDRTQLLGENTPPLSTKIHRWEQGIPHYTVELERLLPEIKAPRGIHLFGNYLGKLGVAKILEAASKLPEEIDHV